MLSSRSPSQSSATPTPARTLRVSQRPPTACRECSQRKVRCDKQTPCGRCVRLSKRCTREVVRISKSLSLHRDELKFLRSLRARLLESQYGSDNAHVLNDAVADIDNRVHFLEHGKSPVSTTNGSPMETVEDEGSEALMHSPAATEEDEPRSTYGGPAAATVPSPTSMATSTASTSSTPATVPTTTTISTYAQRASQQLFGSVQPPPPRYSTAVDHSSRTDNNQDNARNKASILTAFEFLAWGRYSQTCFPHRRCRCYQNRRYSELASINCDVAWIGRQAMSLHVDPDVLLPPDVASKVIQFHMDHLRWHHNAFHGPTFLEKCQQFWRTGTADHPLWLALYFSICSVSLWTLLNNEPHRAALGFAFDESLVERQFQAMVNTLYGENFLENLSLYAVQAIVISTRIAHNLDRTDLNAILVGAAVRIAHCLGLHKISDPVDADATDNTFNWHERVEIETGKRVWLQLVIQDHFQIPYTDTYIIHPSQYITPLPKNCSDDDMVERNASIPTNSSYVRMLGRTASLIPPLLDGLGAMGARKSPVEAYQHILACDRVMRANVAQIPEFLLRDDDASRGRDIKWLPLARRTLAISAAEKIIMIHRPVLFDSFQSGDVFRPTRTTCVAAATTILREHEQTIAEQTISIWTHSAFCVTAAVVLGLELFHRTDHTDDTAHTYRQMMTRAADRLRNRRCDAIAKRGALLIDTLLAAEEDLVLRMMRTARTAPGSSTAEAHQQAIINEMIGSHEIMARFLAIAPPKVDGSSSTGSTPVGAVVDSSLASPQMHIPTLPTVGVAANGLAGGDDAANSGSMSALLASMEMDTGQDFESWFNNVFAPVYDPLL
ncbi:hypothetical protein SEUCBS140593_004064 [Sporothrix eucalyptigena]|uniref:Zn(2)-C6 fungal-type domain-containing protein n=1 Tax=Sporothrix eucalyptigena TaxID=1812306 RepID=A0ABP0BJW3_9PEZI